MTQPPHRRHIATLAILLLTALGALSACGTKEPPLDQYEVSGLLARGLELYRAEEWTDAIRFLDHFVLENPTHPRLQEALFYLADSYYGREEYVTAAGRFTRLAEDFPNGEWADDARFKVCQSYRELSPEPTLDQQYTQAAIDHCRSLVVYHPNSEHAAEATRIVDAMENKLARKALLNAEFYMKRDAFDSAIIYYESVLERWPTSEVAPEALRLMIVAYERIGYDEEAAATREGLLRDYPESDAARFVAGRAHATEPDATTATGPDAGTR